MGRGPLRCEGMTHEQFVIVGAGLAGAKTAEALRAQGHSGGLVLIGDEADHPYDRPPLSKEYLTGKSGRDKVYVHPRDWYAEQGVDLLLGRTVTGIDREARTVSLSSGTDIPYAKLLLSTGSRVRALPVPGGDSTALLTLRRLGDSDRIRGALETVRHLLIVGAGWIGLEVAAAARAADVAVTILEAAELPLLRVLGPEIARSFADLHTDHGVDLRLGASLSEIIIEGDRAVGVRLADRSTISADAVLVAVGILPNIELASAAGLDTDNGITVDAGLRSNDPDIFAAGDVASAFHPKLGRHIRVEHWANALNQPEVAAANMLGAHREFDRLPYFYTDQYDLGMEYLGYVEPGGYDDVVIRGDLTGRQYLAFWTNNGRVLAGMNVNVWDVVDDVRAVIESGAQIPRERLADPSVPLTGLI